MHAADSYRFLDGIGLADDVLEGQPVTSIVVREGDVYAEIEDIRKNVDPQLVVMGTRGLTGLDHLLVGSVAEKMVRISEIPVLTVH